MKFDNLYIDTLTGEEFEEYLLNLFENLGYEGIVTSGSNDYGADLVISKNNEKMVVQAKRYSDVVGISAVQEVIGSKRYYEANKCLVVTNNYFTPNAIELAQSNHVDLWDRDTLIEMITMSLKTNNIDFAKSAKQEPTSLRAILNSHNDGLENYKLPFVLGKGLSGDPIISGIERMPHLLIAGSTGSGKSVFANTIILSLLSNVSSDNLQLILVDSKVVEFSHYNGVPHLCCPVVTDPQKAAGALNWAVQEMIDRYKVFADAGVRDLDRYNDLQEKLNNDVLPQIVVIIDEISDLITLDPKEIEYYIQKLTQNGRAAGIYLIVTTQTTSIINTLKNYFPSKISFLVSSPVDSRAILGMNDAERLMGDGDMLYYPIGASKPIRVQGAYATEHEINEIVGPLKTCLIKNTFKNADNKYTQNKSNEDEIDELFYDAVKIVTDAGQASVSMLQRRLNIGYARAARLIDAMEIRGIVSEFEGSRPRDVLITREKLGKKYIHFTNTNYRYNSRIQKYKSKLNTLVKMLKIPTFVLISFLVLSATWTLAEIMMQEKSPPLWLFLLLLLVSFKLGSWITNKIFGKRYNKNNYTTKL